VHRELLIEQLGVDALRCGRGFISPQRQDCGACYEQQKQLRGETKRRKSFKAGDTELEFLWWIAVEWSGVVRRWNLPAIATDSYLYI